MAPLTVVTTVGIVRRFLTALPACDAAAVTGLTVQQVHGFVLSEADRLSTGATRASLSALRSFLRYLFATGLLSRDLSVTVPRIAGSRLASLPRALPPGTVAALLASCDRRTPIGTRDFAIMTLQVRLGLRANEVAGMQLEDLHWRAGELTVHGKGGRAERLPLPADVGDALVEQVQDLMRCASRLPSPVLAASFATLIGLMGATGLRTSEAPSRSTTSTSTCPPVSCWSSPRSSARPARFRWTRRS